MVDETLRITLPRAIAIGNDQLAAREFTLELFTNTGSDYVRAEVSKIAYTPVQIPVQIWHLRGGNIDVEQVMGANGIINISAFTDIQSSSRFLLFNLSTLSEAHFTLYLTGELQRTKQYVSRF